MKANDMLYIQKKTNGDFEISISVIMFQEEQNTIVYCPSLDLSGYGGSEDEAKDSFAIVLREYIKFADTKGTLVQDLEAHGWKVTKGTELTSTQPSLSSLLSTNENFNTIFNNQPTYKKFDMPIKVAAY